MHDFSDFPSNKFFTTFEYNNVDQWGGENFWNRILKFYHKGSFFQKNAKIAKTFPGLATSGRHNSAMITQMPKTRG